MGAIAAIVSALLINFIVQLTGIVLPYGILGGLVAFVVSLVLFIGVSLVTKKPELAADMKAVLNI